MNEEERMKKIVRKLSDKELLEGSSNAQYATDARSKTLHDIFNREIKRRKLIKMV